MYGVPRSQHKTMGWKVPKQRDHKLASVHAAPAHEHWAPRPRLSIAGLPERSRRAGLGRSAAA
jgi:hypothetical protein